MLVKTFVRIGKELSEKIKKKIPCTYARMDIVQGLAIS